jgi:hypothetical protein
LRRRPDLLAQARELAGDKLSHFIWDEVVPGSGIFVELVDGNTVRVFSNAGLPHFIDVDWNDLTVASFTYPAQT